jgi:hypothetical protein
MTRGNPDSQALEDFLEAYRLLVQRLKSSASDFGKVTL